MDQTPLISIMMCTYNRAQYIEQAIKSVLEQDFTNYELLIIDDASTDTTEHIVAPFLTDSRIRYIKNAQNKGITANRRFALGECRGMYVAVLDSDDYWTDSTKLSTQLAYLEQHQNVAVVGTDALSVKENRTLISLKRNFHSPKYVRYQMLWRAPIVHSSVLYKKDIALAAGGYWNEPLPIEDYALWLAIGINHDIANIPKPMTAYRFHSSQSDAGRQHAIAKRVLRLIYSYRKDYPFALISLLKAVLRIPYTQIKRFL